MAKCDNTSGQVELFIWRVSLLPAAAVILAPLVYIKVVAVKNLVMSLFV